MGKPEAYVETYLRDRCREEGYLCYKFVSPGNNGVPDRIIIGHGEIFFVETKAAGKKPRQEQLIRMKEMQEHDAECWVIDTREGVDELLASRKVAKSKRPNPQKMKPKTTCQCVGMLVPIKR